MTEPFKLNIKDNRVVWPECDTDDRGLNTAIDAHILSDSAMADAGFRRIESTVANNTVVNKSCWYYFHTLEPGFTINVTIFDDGALEIDVLDERFCQPYDYQHILEQNASHSFARKIWAKVETELSRLQERGIITGHELGDYI